MQPIIVANPFGLLDPPLQFVPKSPSAGDGSAALYRLDQLGSAPMFHPRLEITAKSNGNKDARRVEVSINIPYVLSTASGDVIKANMPFKLVGTIPTMIPDETIVANVNIAFDALSNGEVIRQAFITGFAPN